MHWTPGLAVLTLISFFIFIALSRWAKRDEKNK